MRAFVAEIMLIAGLVAPLLAGCSHQDAGAPTAAPSIYIGSSSPRPIQVPEVAAEKPPEIVALGLSKDRFTSGDTVSGWAITSSNVASMVARVQGYAEPLHRDGFGRFSLQVRIPSLPSFVKRDYDLSITAVNTGGDETKAIIPIHVR